MAHDVEDILDLMRIEITTLDTGIGTVATEIATIDTSLATVATEIATIDTSLSTVATEIGTIDTNIGTLATELATIDTSVATVATEIATMDTSIATVATEIATIDTSLATVATEIATIDTSLATVATEIATIDTALGTLKDDVALIKPEIISGVKKMVEGCPTGGTAWHDTNATDVDAAATPREVKAAPGAGYKLAINEVHFYNITAADVAVLDLRDEDDVVYAGPFSVGDPAVSGKGYLPVKFSQPIFLPENKALEVGCTGDVGDSYMTALGYTIAV
jgi:uncharacterized phage infection (PIP) family protein YhgE